MILSNILKPLTTKNRRVSTLVNVFGLALGLAIALLIWMYILHETSYDKFHNDHQNIYRIHSTVGVGQGEPQSLPAAMFELGETIKRSFPEVTEVVRFTTYYHSPDVVFGEEASTLSGILFGEENFFEVFGFDLMAGDPSTVLADPVNIVLSESTAARLAGDPLDALHQTMTIQGATYQVAGIMRDLPENTHMAFNAMANHERLPNQIKASGTNFYTYLRLTPGANIRLLENKLDETVKEIIHTNPLYEGVPFVIKNSLMNLADIHLDSSLTRELKENGSRRNVIIFSLLSMFILIVAIINFVNLSTANSTLRAKEIGIRKVAGASRTVLFKQLMVESVILTSLAFFLAMGLAEAFSPFFSEQMGVHLSSSALYTIKGILLALGTLLFTALLAGIYPAFYLSSFDAAKILKGEMVKGKKGQNLRRVLVVFQFGIALFVISSLMIMSGQLKHLQRSNLGFEQEEVLILRNLSGNLWRNFQPVRARLEAIPRVESTGGGNFIYGGSNRVDLLAEMGTDKESGVLADVLTVDHGFLKSFGLELTLGRNFYEGSQADVQNAFILNETAVNALGFDDPIGKQLDIFNVTGPLIGVVKDFHLKSLHHPIEPLVLIYAQVGFPHIYLRATPGAYEPLMEDITTALREFDPAYTPNIMFLDETIQHMYDQESRTAQLMTTAAILAFVISLMGVYGLAAFSAQRRVKEMGVRIVLGATSKKLLWVFSRETVIICLISMFIAWPTTWFIMNQWLDQFITRIDMSPLYFLLPGLGVLVTGIVIIGAQTWKTTRTNPVNALRSE